MNHALKIPALLLATAALAACGNERSATAETETSKVEVTTELPEGALPEEQLDRMAEEAAAQASASPPATMAVPGQPGQPAPPPPAPSVEAAGTAPAQ